MSGRFVYGVDAAMVRVARRDDGSTASLEAFRSVAYPAARP